MVPLPIALYSKIASPLQLLASRVASTVMNATGVPVLCEGNRMTLPGGLQMFVAEACSGMRQLTGFLALTTAVAYLTTRPVWYRVVIMVSALPIALSANIARVMLTGYIMHFVNPQFALGTYHTLEGLLMMGFGLLLLHCECVILDHIFQIVARRSSSSPETRRDADAAVRGRLFLKQQPGPSRIVSESSGPTDFETPRGGMMSTTPHARCSAARSYRPAWRPRRAWNGSTRPSGPPLRRSLASIPLDIGDWAGKDEPVDADIVERAQTTEYLNRTYESRKQPGLRLRLWINFSLDGTNLRHTPGNLPPFRRLDQDRVADAGARGAARPRPIDRGHEIGLPAR